MPKTSSRNWPRKTCCDSQSVWQRRVSPEVRLQEKEQITKITSSKLGKGQQISSRNWLGKLRQWGKIPNLQHPFDPTWISFPWLNVRPFLYYSSLHALLEMVYLPAAFKDRMFSLLLFFYPLYHWVRGIQATDRQGVLKDTWGKYAWNMGEKNQPHF